VLDNELGDLAQRLALEFRHLGVLGGVADGQRFPNIFNGKPDNKSWF
jgi:hypothetical protein